MNCPTCGREIIPPGSAFCAGCGQKLSQAQSPSQVEDGNSVYVRSQVTKIGQVLFGEAQAAGHVECPVCGGYNQARDTFHCKGCGRPFICKTHQDPRSFLCSECVYKAMEEARRRQEEQARLVRQQAQVEYQRALALFDQKQFHEAEQACRKALEMAVMAFA